MTTKWGVDLDEHDRVVRNEIDEFAKSQIAAEWSYEELQHRYENLEKVTQKNFPNLWFGLEFAISVKTILNVKGISLPFIGIILGPPSSLKTFIVELFRRYYKYTFYTDKFSPRALVSHNSGMKEAELKKIDLLPKIRNKLFLAPELSPMFSVKDEDLIEVLGILTRVADGQGFESDSGVQGHRGYNGTMMYCLLGAAVDIPHKVFKLLGTLGPKLYFFRMPSNPVSEEQYLRLRNEDFHAKKKETEMALLEYLYYFDSNPEIVFEEETESERFIWNGKDHGHGSSSEDYDERMLPKIEMNTKADDLQAHRVIVKLALMLAHLRAVVPTFETTRTQGSQYQYNLPIIEDPSRAMTQMRSLAKGHALSQGRKFITMEDILVVMHMAFSTTTVERVRIFGLLIEHRGTLTTSIICKSLGAAPATARKTMVELRVAGLVDYTTSPEEEEKNNIEMGVILKSEFKWFLSEGFAEIKEALLKEKCPPRIGQFLTK